MEEEKKLDNSKPIEADKSTSPKTPDPSLVEDVFQETNPLSKNETSPDSKNNNLENQNKNSMPPENKLNTSNLSENQQFIPVNNQYTQTKKISEKEISKPRPKLGNFLFIFFMALVILIGAFAIWVLLS